MKLYDTKEETYFTKVRHDIISLFPHINDIKVLEIGAGGGDTLVYLKTKGIAQEVVGVDIFELPNTNQSHLAIDKFIYCDIEKMPLDLPKNHFDVLICGDVLEHLVDPWAVLRKVQEHLKINGVLIVSVPNIRFYAAITNIVLKGDFKYDPLGGVLDKTHLRFFCKKNVYELMDLPGFSLKSVTPIQKFPGHESSWKVKIFNLITLKYFDDFFVSQYIAISEKTE
ncbi:class I SAM-dependent methyltransferase [Fibrella sp. ES10-3-2-2]|nr:hypothetical protein A6C57_05900 [Fibrella sp. ES10-3-2-2]